MRSLLASIFAALGITVLKSTNGKERAEHKDEVDVMDLSTKLKLGHRPLANLLHVVSTLTEDMREIRSRCKKLEEGLKVPDDV